MNINNLSSLRYVATLYEPHTTKDLETATRHETLKDLGTIYFAYYKPKMKYDVDNPKPSAIKNSTVILARHDRRLAVATVKIKIDDTVYQIVEYEPDFNVNGFDVVTLQRAGAGSNFNYD